MFGRFQMAEVSPYIGHPPGGRLPLLSAMPTITFPAAQHHSPLAGTNYNLLTMVNSSLRNVSFV